MHVMLRRLLNVTLAALAALALSPALAQQPVRVGSKNFTEQFILAELYAQAMEAAGIKVERKINLGGTLIAHKALEEKQIDLYPEYTGTMLLAVLKAEPMTDRKAVYDRVKAEYATKGLVVLNEAPLNKTGGLTPTEPALGPASSPVVAAKEDSLQLPAQKCVVPVPSAAAAKSPAPKSLLP